MRKFFLYLIGLVLSSGTVLLGKDIEGQVPDSLLTEAYISSIHLIDPYRAINLLEHAERRGSIPDFRINILKSMVYQGQSWFSLALPCSEKAFASDSVQRSPVLYARATRLLSDIYFRLGRYEEAIRYALLQMENADKMGDVGDKASALFLISKGQRFLSHKEEAYQTAGKAVTLLESSSDIRQLALLSYFYGELSRFLDIDSRVRDALDVCVKREKLIARMDKMKGAPVGYVDQQYGYLYSKMSMFYKTLGEDTLARAYFRKYESTQYASTVKGSVEAHPYWLATHNYERVLDNSRRVAAGVFRGDTINQDYRGLLRDQAEAYAGLGDVISAMIYKDRESVILDSLYARDKGNALSELSVIYQTKEREALIGSQEKELRQQRLLLVASLALTGLLLTLLWIIMRNQRIVRSKNRAMALQIDKLMSCEETIGKMKRRDSSSTVFSPSPNPNNYEDLFDRISTVIKDEKLFLDTQLSRDRVLEVVHMNRTLFGKVLQECAKTNFSDYVNTLRVEYSVRLMRQHPDYTIDSIAMDSGFNSPRTYYRVFKEKLNMTPAEYRKAISE
ncbi:MAG: helix-turn-helix domain-containing protein [Parabacteroides sp.]|nr:helix-turn-helix domain-containing protein [Parabacteroides sp.]